MRRHFEQSEMGGTGGILRHEHIKRIRCFLLLTVKWIDVMFLPLGAGSTVFNCRTFSVSYRLRCPLSLRQLPRQGSQDVGCETAGDMFPVKHGCIEFQAQSLGPSY